MRPTELLVHRDRRASESAVAPPSMVLFFPVYNDDHAVEALAEKSVRVLSEVAAEHEILIVDDGSTDDTGAIVDALAARLPNVRVVRHERNRGYGHAVRTGFAEARRLDWIVFTDGDNQYDIAELRRFLPLLDRYDVLVGYRFQKTYGVVRKLLSAGLNLLVRVAFGVRVRDVTCGFKMVRSRVMEDPEMQLTSTGPFGGGEVVVRAALRGYHVGEVGISMYPRDYGRSSIVSFRNVVATLKDLRRVRRDVFRNRVRAD